MIETTLKKPLMILGTSSGSGKSLMTTAICRVLLRKGESPLPFKGQNMSNNAWVDHSGGEMAHSQAVQAWAAGIEPICAMNPILLKPKGDCISEVIHLGKSVGFANAASYYEDWFVDGWKSIKKGLKTLSKISSEGRLVLEGAGSPVEVNLQHKDLTNLKLAKYLNASCILIADIERGGVFAQIIGTLALLKPVERNLIKGLLINRFRGDRSLFDSGKEWLEKETGIPVIGIMPWIEEVFPPEDSLDLIERKRYKKKAEIDIAIIKLPSLSNFSDFDPLEAEPSVNLIWITPGQAIGNPDCVILPGSKQTIKDLKKLVESGLAKQLKKYFYNGGNLLGICGGLQMMGKYLYDPEMIETTKDTESTDEINGLDLLPITTHFCLEKRVSKREVISTWPEESKINGFELHHGKSFQIKDDSRKVQYLTKDSGLGWILINNGSKNVVGTYLHGIFDNNNWRRQWLNHLRKKKNLVPLISLENNYSKEREIVLNKLANIFEDHIDLSKILEE